MDIPFSLSLSAASPHGILWNPWGATVPNSVDNAVLTGLTAEQQEQFGLLVPKRACFMQGFIVMGDTADQKVTIGVYDTAAGAFRALYPIVATVVAGGGVVGQSLDTGIYLPLSSTLIPVIKLTTAGSLLCTGHISTHWVAPGQGQVTGVGPTITMYLQEESLANLTDESTVPLRQESL